MSANRVGKCSSPDRWLVGAVVAQVAGILIGVIFCLSFLVEDDMAGWLGDMIANIAQDARQTKAVQYDMWTRNKERDYFTADRALNFGREDTAIQRRVADAQAAGVHPLFALGASVGGQGAYFVSGGSSAAQSPGGAGMDIPSAMDIEAHNAAMRESGARADMYTAQAAEASARARQAQSANVQQDHVKLVADQMTSSQSTDPSVSAGRDHPAYREYVVTQYGLKMDLPYSEEGPSEALENVPFYLWPAIINHNRAKYGDDWGTRFYQEFVLGRAPKYRPESMRPKWYQQGGYDAYKLNR